MAAEHAPQHHPLARLHCRQAPMVKSVDTADLKSAATNMACRFKSGSGHHLKRRRADNEITRGATRPPDHARDNASHHADPPCKKGSLRRLPFAIWSGIRDSNSRPIPWQGIALPTELIPHCLHRCFAPLGSVLSEDLNFTSFLSFRSSDRQFFWRCGPNASRWQRPNHIPRQPKPPCLSA